jgi:hypothetical protein
LARRKKKGRARNIAIVSIIAIIIFAGAYFTVPEVRTAITSTGLVTPDLVIPIGDDDSWTLPTVFKFALGDFDGVHCVIDMKITQFNVDGTSEPFIFPAQLQVELLRIVGGLQSSAKEISFFKGQPFLSCWDTTSTRHTVTLSGGSFSTDFRVLEDGQIKTLSSTVKTIPALNKNLNIVTGGGNVGLPSITVQASAIESFLSFVPDTVAERTIDIFFNTKGFASIRIDGTVSKAGDLSAGAGGKAKFINEDFNVGGTGTGKGTKVILQSTVPTQFYYLGSATPVPSGVNANQVIRDGDRMTLSFTGVQDNWSSAEGQPTITIKSPTGATITSTQMSFSRSITGGLAEFKTTVAIPIVIGAPNIDLWKGTWTAQMKQAGRLQVGSSTFALGDYRAPEFIPPPPEICQFPKIIIGGECVDQPPDVTPTPDQCPPAVDLLLAVRGLTNDELRSTWFSLEDKEDAGTLDVCEVNVKPLVETEMVRRGFSLTEDPTEPIDPTQPPIIPAGSAKAYIRYAGSYTDAEATMLGAITESCKNDATGIVPPQGLAITGFQLLGLNACDGFRFGSVELIPTLDFGTGVSAVIIDKDSFAIKQELIISVNQPIPNEPTFACTVPTSSNPAGTCTVTNFAQVNNRVGGLGGAGFTSVGVTEFVDKSTSGEFQIVKTSLRESLVIDKIQRNSVVINDGDKIDVLYYIYGTFRGTHNGENFIGKLPFGGTSGMLAYVQHYEFDTSIGDVTCEDPSKIVIIVDATNPEPRLATGDETGRCTPCDELETLGLGTCPFLEPVCLFPNAEDPVTGECKPPDDDTCPDQQIRDLITGECRESICQQEAPMCVDGQFHDISTTEIDDCNNALIICVDSPNGGDGNGNGNGEPIPNTCPSPLTQYRDSLGICVNIDSGTCPEGQARNSIGVCEETGRIVNPEPPTAPPNEDVNLCSLDKNFNIAQCFASLFTGDGTGGLQLTGATLIGVIIFVVVIIAIIIIAVIVRRRGGGLNI